MAGKIFYKALDSIIPGGTLGDLDKSVVPNRSIYLTRISMNRLEEMHEYSKDERLYRYFEFEPFKNINETRAYLQKLINRIGEEINDRNHMYWFIRLLDTNKIIGSVGLVDIDIKRESASWGYAISPDYWGGGYILEVQAIVMKYFFEVLKMNRLWGVAFVSNAAAISSVLAAGFKKEGILRDYYVCYDGRKEDGFIYSLLAKEYFTIRESGSFYGKDPVLTLDDIKEICVSLFKVPDSSICINTVMSDIPSWDSLNHINFIIAVEKKSGFKFKPAEIAMTMSINNVLKIVNSGAGKTSC